MVLSVAGAVDSSIALSAKGVLQFQYARTTKKERQSGRGGDDARHNDVAKEEQGWGGKISGKSESTTAINPSPHQRKLSYMSPYTSCGQSHRPHST